MAIQYFTKESYDRLKAELDELKNVGRTDAAKAIAEAREKGDLSENAEYDAAKDAQGMLELKISQLDNIMANARVLDASEIDLSRVAVLTQVKIRNQANGKEMTYRLVSEAEADLKQGKLSVTSPIGKGLLGKAQGDMAQVQTPAGQMIFEILEISA